jgi:hypothetical protein
MRLTSLLFRTARFSGTGRAIRRGPRATAKRAVRIGVRLGTQRRPALATLRLASRGRHPGRHAVNIHGIPDTTNSHG